MNFKFEFVVDDSRSEITVNTVNYGSGNYLDSINVNNPGLVKSIEMWDDFEKITEISFLFD